MRPFREAPVRGLRPAPLRVTGPWPGACGTLRASSSARMLPQPGETEIAGEGVRRLVVDEPGGCLGRLGESPQLLKKAVDASEL
ncbi:hypothetical protein GCM10009546_51460 [Actinomadura livida]|uniref:Uncharacterized protein n=1 Tax=Actinomadura livida TaxID=79909 RepID=A0ABN1F5Z4_9ACTN|nr:hypothetical protein GCM10010208_72170 [Actinomadura livida]